MKIYMSFYISVLLITFLLTIGIQAQNNSVSGTVQDQNGANIVGVVVVLRNTDTGIERTFVTNEIGQFTFTKLIFAIFLESLFLKQARVTILCIRQKLVFQLMHALNLGRPQVR